MKKTILYAVVKVTPKEYPLLENEEQEKKFKDKFASDIKSKLTGYEVDIRFVLKTEKG